jgi:hypothetical protein
VRRRVTSRIERPLTARIAAVDTETGRSSYPQGLVAVWRSLPHEYQDVVLNTGHTHQGEWCLESLFCRGDAERVRSLTYRLRDFDAVRRVKVMAIREEAV